MAALLRWQEGMWRKGLATLPGTLGDEAAARDASAGSDEATKQLER